MKTEEFRNTFRERIMNLFSGRDWMLGIWEGGSAATGYLDDLSDLDLGFVVEDNMVEETFRLFEELLEEHYSVTGSFRIPEPSWHGHSQCYYFVKNCPPLFYVDLLVEKESAGNRLLEPDRHGESRIWLNRKNVLDPKPTDPGEMHERNRKFFSLLVETTPITATEVRKQILRGNTIDAMLEYQGYIQRKLAGFLNLRFRRSRYDFGIRYGGREYPGEVAERVSRLMYPGSMEELGQFFNEACGWVEELMAELKDLYS